MEVGDHVLFQGVVIGVAEQARSLLDIEAEVRLGDGHHAATRPDRPIGSVGLDRLAMITENPGAVLSSRARTMGSVSAQPSTTW